MTHGLPVRLRFVFLLLLACTLLLSAHALAQDKAHALAQAQPAGPPRVLDEDTDRPVVELPPLLDSPSDGGSSTGGTQPRSAAADPPELPWTRVVYYARNSNNWDIYSSDDQGQDTRQLTNSSDIEVTPDLSRGGRVIVYSSNETGNFEIWAMNDQGGGAHPITDHIAEDGQPVWSPDNGYIAFVSDRDGQSEIYTMRPDGSEQTRLTFSPDYDGDPTWSPDGTQIAFTSRRTGGYRIYVMNADGSGQTQRSTTPFSMRPAWSPDGTWIAYSADSDGDGWLDLRYMRTSSWTDYGLFNPSGAVDALVSGWSPNAKEVTYTEYRYAFIQGNWYIGQTFLRTVELVTHSESQDNFGSADQFPLNPVWESLDTEAPQSRVAALPGSSPAAFLVRWDGSDAVAGVIGFDLQYQIDNGAWVSWKINTGDKSAEFVGQSGQRIAFRSRARDAAYNLEPWAAVADVVTTVEQLPPETHVWPLNPYTRVGAPFLVNWAGADPGGSGITAYQVQYRIANGAWVDWVLDPLATQAKFAPVTQGVPLGQSVAFRVRGTDRAGNLEAWPPGSGDTTTTVYRWAIAGQIHDNTGVPVDGANVTSTPTALGPAVSDTDGRYGLFGGEEAATAALAWTKAGYGALPLTVFSTQTDWQANVGLPPANDVVVHGGFETAWPDPAWTQTGYGDLPLKRSAGDRLTGGSALAFGDRTAVFGDIQQVNDAETQALYSSKLFVVNGVQPVALWATDNLVTSERLADGTWSTPRSLAPMWFDTFSAVEDEFGRLHVLVRDSTGLVYLRRSTAGTWTAPEPVPYDAADAFDLRLAVGPGDTLHLVWQGRGDQSHLIFYGQRAASGWQPSEIVVDVYGWDIKESFMAVGSDGVVHVVWTYSSDVMARDRSSDGVWQNEVAVSSLPIGEHIFLVQPQVDDAGRVHLLWVYNIQFDPQPYLYYAQQDSGQWRTPEMIGNLDVPVQMALSTNGEPRVVAWEEDYKEVLIERTPGGSWTSPRVVADPGYFGDSGLVVDEADRTHFAWPADQIGYRRLDPDGTLLAPAWISSPKIYNDYLQQALDSRGNAHLLWLGRDSPTIGQLYDVYYAGPAVAAEAGEAAVTQQVTIPADMAHPVLSFHYAYGGISGSNTGFDVVVNGTAQRLPLHPDGMTHHWIDLSAYAGQTVTITFRLRQAAGAAVSWATLEDVSVGSAHPDVWLRGQNGLALPGETAELTIRVGNRAGVAAANVLLNLTLPPELTFVSASPVPTITSPYQWALGDLPAGAEQTIIVRVSTQSTAALFSQLTATATVTADAELETSNNSADPSIGLWRAAYLPGITGP